MSRARAVAAFATACGMALGACGSDDDGGRVQTATATVPVAPAPEQIDAPVPVALPPARRARFVAGRTVATRSGCLACHRIGTTGSDAPGSNLTGIGERRSRAELRQALVDPRGAMPSYDELPSDELDALVTFLSALGDATCPDDSDCG